MTRYEKFECKKEEAKKLLDRFEKDSSMSKFFKNVIVGLNIRQNEMSIEDAQRRWI